MAVNKELKRWSGSPVGRVPWMGAVVYGLRVFSSPGRIFWILLGQKSGGGIVTPLNHPMSPCLTKYQKFEKEIIVHVF